MSISPTAPARSRMPRTFVALGAMLAAAALTVATALPASASIDVVDPSGPFARTGTTSPVTVEGTISGFPAADRVAVAVCNIEGLDPEDEDFQADASARCDADSGSPLLTPTSGDWGTEIDIQRTFTNFNFATQSAGVGTTTCKDEDDLGDQCAVLASYYDLATGFTPIGAEVVAIDFEAAP